MVNYTAMYKKVEKLLKQVKKLSNKIKLLENTAIQSISAVKPFLKWVGGKTQILNDVLELFPRTIANYHEPFVGGGSVLLGMLSAVKAGNISITGKIYASDLNPNIINLYKAIQTQPADLIREVRALLSEYTPLKGTEINRKPSTHAEALTSQESYYYWVRAQFNDLRGEHRQSPKAAAMCLFLNKTNFRGVYRDGPHGFNVPFGHNKNVSVIDDAHIQAVSELIRDVVFSVRPFQESLATLQSGDFVYLDPPYAPKTTTSFTGYTTEGFNLDAHNALFTACKTLKPNKVAMLMSNADVKLVRDAFPLPEFQTKIISCRRAIHSKDPGAKTNEVLITN